MLRTMPAFGTMASEFYRLMPRRFISANREKMNIRVPEYKSEGFCFSEITMNNDQRIVALIIDMDIDYKFHEVSDFDNSVKMMRDSGSLDIWRENEMPEPNLIVQNPKSGHAHYYYFLKNPLFLKFANVEAKVLPYAKAVQRGLATALGADVSWAWDKCTSHNPFYDGYKTFEGRQQLYTLLELSTHVDMNIAPASWSVKKSKIWGDRCRNSIEGERNRALFDGIRFSAYEFAATGMDIKELSLRVAQVAAELNATFCPILTQNEVAATVKSVCRYSIKKARTSSVKLSVAGRRKLKRAEANRSVKHITSLRGGRIMRAIEMQARGFSKKDIAIKFGVCVRTITRWLNNVKEALITGLYNTNPETLVKQVQSVKVNDIVDVIKEKKDRVINFFGNSLKMAIANSAKLFHPMPLPGYKDYSEKPIWIKQLEIREDGNVHWVGTVGIEGLWKGCLCDLSNADTAKGPLRNVQQPDYRSLRDICREEMARQKLRLST